MPSTYTSSNRFTKQGIGENASTWGNIANTVYDLIDEATDGVTSVSVSNGATTILTTQNGASDQARHRVIQVIGDPATEPTIEIPDQEKFYLVHLKTSTSTSVKIKNTAGTGYVIPPMRREIIYCDGTSVYPFLNNFMRGTNNLSDVTSADSARTNLGLGTAATYAVGTTLSTIPVLVTAGLIAATMIPTATSAQAIDASATTVFMSPARTKEAIQTKALYPEGVVVQTTVIEYTANSDITGTFNFDDTPPLSSEGTEIISHVLTLTSANNRVRYQIEGQWAGNASVGNFGVAFFNGVSVTAMAAQPFYNYATNVPNDFSLTHEHFPAAVSVSIRVRVGHAGAGIVRLNGTTGGRLFGGVNITKLIITEFKA